MIEVYLALGSNLGSSQANILLAIDLLGQELKNIRQAPLYNSRPVGYTDQPDFINTVISALTDLEPLKLLEITQKIERKVGRVKTFRWGPREIDIDIIFYGQQLIESGELSIPHPRFQDRGFVLKPLCDLDPKTVDPRSKITVKELFDKLPENDKKISVI